MQKKLVRFGNSYALIIDAPIRRQLRIDGDSLLHVTIACDRLIVERSRDDAQDPVYLARRRRAERIRKLTLLLRDLDALGMNALDFASLSFDKKQYGEFQGLVSLGEEVDPITVLRLQRCAARRRSLEESWEATIEAVVTSTPSPREASRASRPATRKATGCKWRSRRVAAQRASAVARRNRRERRSRRPTTI